MGCFNIGLGNDLYALDGSTGHGLWRYTTSSGVSNSPVVANGKLYIASGNSLYAFGLPSSAGTEQSFPAAVTEVH
jgi:outer membrane protein assembly factor BamB